MKAFLKRFIPILLIAALVWAGWANLPYLEMVAAYKAKSLCSAAYVSGRDIGNGAIADVSEGPLEPLKFLTTKIEEADKSISVSLFGFRPSTAVYREGIGSTLAIGISPEELRSQTQHPRPDFTSAPDKLWPQGNRVILPSEVAGLDLLKLNQVVDKAFDNRAQTRAVVVVSDGRIVSEKYATGFSADMPLKGWSMAKGVTNALIGILVRDGKLSLKDQSLLTEWSSPGDPRAEISLDHLMRMSSGLRFKEDYSIDPEGDISMMLLRTGNASKFAAAKTLAKPPGTFFQYSSGTSNILSLIIRRTINNDAEYYRFPYRELFHPIGAGTALIERDASGTFVGSSFLYAIARDWARIGLLYANDGVWEGNRILPEGWVDYSRTPTPTDPKGGHGAHFWVKIQGQSSRPPLPSGIFHMAGHEGQFVSILPEQKLVVVRLGLTLERGMWNQEKFVGQVLSCFE